MTQDPKHEPAQEPLRIRNPSAAHLYEIGTDKGRIEVEANSRAEAARIARDAGYEVWDVNMVG